MVGMGVMEEANQEWQQNKKKSLEVLSVGVYLDLQSYTNPHPHLSPSLSPPPATPPPLISRLCVTFRNKTVAS